MDDRPKSPQTRRRLAARAKLRRLMKSGALKKALIEYATATDATFAARRGALAFGSTAKLVAEMVDLDAKQGEDDSSNFFKRFVAVATSSEDNTKSVEKQAEMASAGNDK